MFVANIFPGTTLNVMVMDTNGAHDPLVMTCPVTAVTNKLVTQNGVTYCIPHSVTLDMDCTSLAGEVVFTLDDLDPEVSGNRRYTNLFYATNIKVTVLGMVCDLTVHSYLVLNQQR